MREQENLISIILYPFVSFCSVVDVEFLKILLNININLYVAAVVFQFS